MDNTASESTINGVSVLNGAMLAPNMLKLLIIIKDNDWFTNFI